MRNSFDAIVIGGGIVGSAIAFELSRRGVKHILLLEKTRLASGASGICGGAVRSQWSSRLNAALAAGCGSHYAHLDAYTNDEVPLPFDQTGSLLICCNEEEAKQLPSAVDMMKKSGSSVQMLDIEQAICQHASVLSQDGLTAASFCLTDGHANAGACTFAYVRAAQRLGVCCLTQTEAQQITVANGHVTGVQTNHGYFRSELVINATGVCAAGLAAQVGDDLPVFPERRQVARLSVPNDLDADLILPLILLPHRRLSLQLLTDRTLIVNIAAVEPVSFDYTLSWQFLERIGKLVTESFPTLDSCRVLRQWAGTIDVSPDHTPIIEFSNHAVGFVSVCGFSGHGFSLAPRTAVLLANAVSGNQDELDIADYSCSRYDAEECCSEQWLV